MAIKVRKRENESVGGLLFRFSKKIRRSGVMLEARKRRFKSRTVSKRSRKLSAIYKADRRKRIERAKKLGII